MSRTLLIVTSIALSTAIFPIASFAADPVMNTTTPTTESTNTNTVTEMTKDSWLGQMNPLLPDVVCKGFKKHHSFKMQCILLYLINYLTPKTNTLFFN